MSQDVARRSRQIAAMPHLPSSVHHATRMSVLDRLVVRHGSASGRCRHLTLFAGNSRSRSGLRDGCTEKHQLQPQPVDTILQDFMLLRRAQKLTLAATAKPSMASRRKCARQPQIGPGPDQCNHGRAGGATRGSGRLAVSINGVAVSDCQQGLCLTCMANVATVQWNCSQHHWKTGSLQPAVSNTGTVFHIPSILIVSSRCCFTVPAGGRSTRSRHTAILSGRPGA